LPDGLLRVSGVPLPTAIDSLEALAMTSMVNSVRRFYDALGRSLVPGGANLSGDDMRQHHPESAIGLSRIPHHAAVADFLAKRPLGFAWDRFDGNAKEK
jgi:hypothetical protein